MRQGEGERGVEGATHLGSRQAVATIVVNNSQLKLIENWQQSDRGSPPPSLPLSVSAPLAHCKSWNDAVNRVGAKATAQSTVEREQESRGSGRGGQWQTGAGAESLLSCVVHRKLYGNQDHASIMTSDNENLLLPPPPSLL